MSHTTTTHLQHIYSQPRQQAQQPTTSPTPLTTFYLPFNLENNHHGAIIAHIHNSSFLLTLPIQLHNVKH